MTRQRKIRRSAALFATLVTALALITPNVAFAQNSAQSGYSDVSVDSPFYGDVSWLTAQGIAAGYPDGTFHPTDPVTRGAIAAYLYRYANPDQTAPPCTTAPFSDVTPSNLFCPEITWLAQQQIGLGYSDGSFAPARVMSRAALAEFLYRFTHGSAGGGPCDVNAAFPDVPASAWFCTAVAWMSHTRPYPVTQGYGDGKFHPTYPAARETIAAYLHRAYTDGVANTQYDSFARSNRNLNGDFNSAGGRYTVQFDPGHTQLRIENHHMVRGDKQNYGPNGAPILLVQNAVAPTTIEASYAFTRGGDTDSQNVVIGACAVGFGAGSVQFAVFPDRWQLFYVYHRSGAASSDIVVVAQGKFAHSLRTDGQTEYQTRMQVDLATSSVTVDYPGGTVTYQNPVVAQYWGGKAGVQIRRPHPTDGDAAVTWFASGPSPLQAQQP